MQQFYWISDRRRRAQSHWQTHLVSQSSGGNRIDAQTAAASRTSYTAQHAGASGNPQSATSSSSAEWRWESTANDEGLACPRCSAAFRRKNGLTKHLRAKSCQQTCKLCGKAFKYKRSAISHSKICEGTKLFHCLGCNRSFDDDERLNRHAQVAHTLRERKCTYCKIVRFCTELDFEKHLRKCYCTNIQYVNTNPDAVALGIDEPVVLNIKIENDI